MERLPGVADSHCHLQHERFDADREAILERAVAAGIERILVPGWDLASSEAALELAARHAPLVQAAVGIHPHDAASATEEDWANLARLAAEPACVAIGEIGLDFHRNLSPRERQLGAFHRELDLAASLGKAVLVHDREAHGAVTEALLTWPGRRHAAARGALHAFSGDADMAVRLADAGFLISFALPVAFRSAAGPRAAAAALPASAILLETDAPFLGPDRDGRNEPTTAIRVAAELARICGTSPEEVARGARAAYDALVSPTAPQAS